MLHATACATLDFNGGGTGEIPRQIFPVPQSKRNGEVP